MFWGCKIKDNLPYAINVNGECILNISHICLKDQYSKGKIFVKVLSKKEEYVISILQKNINDHHSCNLILNLNKDEQQKIYLTGAKGEIHLTGCIMLKYKSQLNKELKKPKDKTLIETFKEAKSDQKDTKPQPIESETKIKESKGHNSNQNILDEDSDIDMNEIDYLLKKRKRSLSK